MERWFICSICCGERDSRVGSWQNALRLLMNSFFRFFINLIIITWHTLCSILSVLLNLNRCLFGEILNVHFTRDFFVAGTIKIRIIVVVVIVMFKILVAVGVLIPRHAGYYLQRILRLLLLLIWFGVLKLLFLTIKGLLLTWILKIVLFWRWVLA